MYTVSSKSLVKKDLCVQIVFFVVVEFKVQGELSNLCVFNYCALLNFHILNSAENVNLIVKHFKKPSGEI